MMKNQYHPDEEYLPPIDIQQDGSPLWVFVFPSTFGGQHDQDHSLAKAAHLFYGATTGSTHGRQGRAYAIQTYISRLEPVTLSKIERSVAKFLAYAKHRQDAHEQFWIPSLMLSQITYNQLAPLFRNPPSNVSFPASWAYHLETPEDLITDYVVQCYTTTQQTTLRSLERALGQHTDICV